VDRKGRGARRTATTRRRRSSRRCAAAGTTRRSASARQIIDKYNETAKNLIQSINR